MITVTRTYTRPDIDVPWHLSPPYDADVYPQSFKDYVEQTYGSTLLHFSNVVSDDMLTLHFNSVWSTMEDYQRYLVDPVCTASWAARDAHNEQFGIISSPSVITEL